MAAIEIGPLIDRFGDDEIAELMRALQKAGAPKYNIEDGDSSTIADGIGDEAIAEFLDHLEASDLACEIYLPIDFEGRVEAADVRLGSLSSLIDALEDLKDELAIADEDEDEDEDEDTDEDEDSSDIDLVEKQVRAIWQYFYDGAHTALDRKMPLIVST